MGCSRSRKKSDRTPRRGKARIEFFTHQPRTTRKQDQDDRDHHEVLMLVQHVFRHAPGAGITVDKSRRVATAGADYFRQRARIVIRRSADGGRTFDHGSVWDGVTGLNELRQLQSGRVVAAFCFMDPERSDAGKKIQHYTLVALFSDDGGRTWTRSNEIAGCPG